MFKRKKRFYAARMPVAASIVVRVEAVSEEAAKSVAILAVDNSGVAEWQKGNEKFEFSFSCERKLSLCDIKAYECE